MMKHLNWGVVSTARINERFLDAAQHSSRSSVGAVASRRLEAGVEYASARGIDRAYGSYTELIADDAIDAVYVSLPNSLHAEWVLAAVRAGKHVYCEKPLATAAADVDRIIVEADANGVVVREACAMSYHEQTDRIGEFVRDGLIGTVRLVRAWFGFTLPNDVDPRLDPTLDGGALWDLGCYPIGLTRALLSQSAVEVTGAARRGATGVDVSFFGQVRYSSGAVLQVATSMEAPATWSFEVIGSSGMLRITEPFLTQIGATSEVLLRAPTSLNGGTFGDEPLPAERCIARFERPNAYVDALGAFERCVLDGQPSAFSLADTRCNVAVVEALHASAEAGHAVRVQP